MSRLFAINRAAAKKANEKWQERIRAHRLKMSLIKINQLIISMKELSNDTDK